MFRPIMRRTGARYLLSSAEFSAYAGDWLHEERARTTIVQLPDVARLGDGPRRRETHEGAPLFIQFSSGTTGLRKSIGVSSRMLENQARSFGTAIDLTPADVVVSWAPFYHDLGLLGCFLVPLVLGVASVHLPTFEWVQRPVLLFEAASRYRATRLFMPNFAYSFCGERISDRQLQGLKLDSVRALYSGGEPVRESSWNKFLQRFERLGLRRSQLQVIYGMAENTFVVTTTSPGREVRVEALDKRAFYSRKQAQLVAPEGLDEEEVLRFVSCGTPIPEQRLRIAGGASERQIGEIEIHSDCLMPDYLATEDAVERPFTADGWYRTGDLGYLADGELFVVGRSKDMIIHRGSNLYPEDLEEVINALEDCKGGRVVVFGVPDEVEGTEQVVALLEPASGAPDEEVLRQQIREVVHGYFGLMLHDVRVCPPGTLLKSTSGKISRSANREMYLRSR